MRDIDDMWLCGGDAWEWDGTRPEEEEDEEPPANRPEVAPKQETRQVAAKVAGFSSTTEYRRAKTVVEHGTPELLAAMDAGKVSISRAAEIAKLPAEQQQERLQRPRNTGEGDAHIRLPREMFDALAKIAKRRGQSVSDLAVELIATAAIRWRLEE